RHKDGRTLRRRLLPVFLVLLITLASVAFLLNDSSDSSATGPFNPTFDVFVSNPSPSANSNLRIATSTAAGDQALGTWSVFMPAGWDVKGDSQVPDGEVTAQGTMSVDVDCDGSIHTFAPLSLVDTAVFP